MNRLQKESLNNQELAGVGDCSEMFLCKWSVKSPNVNLRTSCCVHIVWIDVKNAFSFCTLVTCGFVLVTFFDNHFPKDSSELVGPGYSHRT